MELIDLGNGYTRIVWDQPTIFCPSIRVRTDYLKEHPVVLPNKSHYTIKGGVYNIHPVRGFMASWDDYYKELEAAQMKYIKAYREWARENGHLHKSTEPHIDMERFGKNSAARRSERMMEEFRKRSGGK